MSKIILFFFLLAAVAAAIAAGYFYNFENTKQPADSSEKSDEFIGVWCGKENCYWFNQDGRAVKPAPRPEGSLVIVVTDASFNLAEGQMILEKNMWERAKAVLDSWIVRELKVNEFLIDREKQEFTAKANQFDILLSLRFNPTVNLNTLKEMNLEGKYFDLRIENKIYYR